MGRDGGHHHIPYLQSDNLMETSPGGRHLLRASDHAVAPTHWKSDLLHDQRMIMTTPGDIRMVLWGVRYTGTHIILLMGDKMAPNATARIFGPEMPRAEFIKDAVRSIVKVNPWWYNIGLGEFMKVSPDVIIEIVTEWVNEGKDVALTL